MTAAVDFWNRMAATYTAGPVVDVPAYERTLARVREHLKPTDRVLELGCGSGATAIRLAPLVAEYLATDLSPAMVAIAEEKLAAEPRPNLRFAAGTAETIAAGHGSPFDAVLGLNLLHLVADLPATLATIHGLVRPGGVFISKTTCLGDMNPVAALAIPVLRLFGKAPPVVGRFSASELAAAMSAAGFAVGPAENHASRGRDGRVFIVARRPG